MALAFAEHGADVVVGDVRRDPREGGAPTDAEITARGGSAVFVEADVSRTEDIDRLVAAAVERGGRLDVIVTTPVVAGRSLQGPARDRRPRTGTRSWPSACAACSSAAGAPSSRCSARSRAARPAGGSSISPRSTAWSATPGHVAYCAAKGGVVNLTHQLAVDFGPAGRDGERLAPGKILSTPSTSPTPRRCSPTRTRARRSPAWEARRRRRRRRCSWPPTSARM